LCNGAQQGWDWYGEEVRSAYRLVARHVYRDKGAFAYAAFDHLNGTYFGGRLPEPLILWDITGYGGCLAWTRSQADGPPVIKLHPSLVTPSAREARRRERRTAGQRRTPWNVSADLLGWCYAYQTLLHECIHAGVNYLLGGYQHLPECRPWWTSHNNPLWVAEVNRIAGLMGLDITFSMKTYQRVPSGPPDGKGRVPTTVKYLSDGPAFERFPYELPGAEDFCRRGELPFTWAGRPAAPASAAARS
jgi:hypothetical protein